MLIKQLYTGCLSEAAYYIESNGEAAIIDPLRDTDAYLQLVSEKKSTLKYIFETQFHADSVSGHLDLHKATGAPIVYGPGTETNFPIHLSKDGEQFKLGKITIETIHTPGHTIESTCYLLKDESGKPHAVFTGDTLLVGDAGRPDLSSGSVGKEELASIMFDSLRNKLMTLPDEVLVYPAHGAGSSCGKNLGPETASTIGEQKQTNYALQPQSREDFVKSITRGPGEPPQYFPVNALINKEGDDSLDNILSQSLAQLTIKEFKNKIQEEGTVIIDTRPSLEFTQGFVPGSVNIGLEGRFAEWAGVVLPFAKQFLLVATKGTEKEAVIRLARVGFSNIDGFLEGGFNAWKDAGESIDLIIEVEADELAMDLPHDKNMVVIDVRRETEFGDGHIDSAVNIPLDELNDPLNIAKFEENQNIYIHCGSGYRSVIAASLFKRHGYHNIRNVAGGFDKIREQKNIRIVKENSVLN